MLEFEGGQYQFYEDREPGYSNCWLQAYNYAFQAPKDGKIKKDFMLAIHRIAMGFDKINDHQSYRQEPGNFSVAPSKYNNDPSAGSPHFNGSIDGLNEFIRYWCIDSPNRIHSLSFLSESGESFAIVDYNNDSFKWVKRSSIKDDSIATELLNIEQTNKRAHDCFLHSSFECVVDIMPFCADGLMANKIESELDRIIADFDQEIALPDSDKITRALA